MNPQPDDTEPASAQQPYPLEILREPVPKLGVLISREEVPNIEALGIFMRLVDDIDGLFLIVLVVAERVAFLAAVVFLLLPLPFE